MLLKGTWTGFHRASQAPGQENETCFLPHNSATSFFSPFLHSHYLQGESNSCLEVPGSFEYLPIPHESHPHPGMHTANLFQESPCISGVTALPHRWKNPPQCHAPQQHHSIILSPGISAGLSPGTSAGQISGVVAQPFPYIYARFFLFKRLALYARSPHPLLSAAHSSTWPSARTQNGGGPLRPLGSNDPAGRARRWAPRPRSRVAGSGCTHASPEWGVEPVRGWRGSCKAGAVQRVLLVGEATFTPSLLLSKHIPCAGRSALDKSPWNSPRLIPSTQQKLTVWL